MGETKNNQYGSFRACGLLQTKLFVSIVPLEVRLVLLYIQL